MPPPGSPPPSPPYLSPSTRQAPAPVGLLLFLSLAASMCLWRWWWQWRLRRARLRRQELRARAATRPTTATQQQHSVRGGAGGAYPPTGGHLLDAFHDAGRSSFHVPTYFGLPLDLPADIRAADDQGMAVHDICLSSERTIFDKAREDFTEIDRQRAAAAKVKQASSAPPQPQHQNAALSATTSKARAFRLPNPLAAAASLTAAVCGGGAGCAGGGDSFRGGGAASSSSSGTGTGSASGDSGWLFLPNPIIASMRKPPPIAAADAAAAAAAALPTSAMGVRDGGESAGVSRGTVVNDLNSPLLQRIGDMIAQWSGRSEPAPVSLPPSLLGAPPASDTAEAPPVSRGTAPLAPSPLGAQIVRVGRGDHALNDATVLTGLELSA